MRANQGDGGSQQAEWNDHEPPPGPPRWRCVGQQQAIGWRWGWRAEIIHQRENAEVIAGIVASRLARGERLADPISKCTCARVLADSPTFPQEASDVIEAKKGEGDAGFN